MEDITDSIISVLIFRVSPLLAIPQYRKQIEKQSNGRIAKRGVAIIKDQLVLFETVTGVHAIKC